MPPKHYRTGEIARYFVHQSLSNQVIHQLNPSGMDAIKKAFGTITLGPNPKPINNLLQMYAKKIVTEDASYTNLKAVFISTVASQLTEEEAHTKFDELLAHTLGALTNPSDVYDYDTMVKVLHLTSDLINNHLLAGEFDRGLAILDWLIVYLYKPLDMDYVALNQNPYWKDMEDAKSEEFGVLQPTRRKRKAIMSSDKVNYMPGRKMPLVSGAKATYFGSELSGQGMAITGSNLQPDLVKHAAKPATTVTSLDENDKQFVDPVVSLVSNQVPAGQPGTSVQLAASTQSGAPLLLSHAAGQKADCMTEAGQSSNSNEDIVDGAGHHGATTTMEEVISYDTEALPDLFDDLLDQQQDPTFDD